MHTAPRLFGYEPALIVGFLAAAITTIGTLGFSWMDNTQAALLVIVVNAALGALLAWLVRPISPVAFTFLVGSVAQLAAAYGYDVPTATLGAINGLVIAALTLITRGQVSPVPTEEEPVTEEGVTT